MTAPAPAAATHTGSTPLRLTYAWIALAHAVLVCLQPILAGLSLQGEDAALDVHYYNGMAIIAVAVLQIIAAVLWWKPGGGTSRALSVSVVLLVLEALQFMLGSSEMYAVHIPLGILTLLGAVMAARLGFRGSRSARATTPETPAA